MILGIVSFDSSKYEDLTDHMFDNCKNNHTSQYFTEKKQPFNKFPIIESNPNHFKT